jgi:DNA-binding MarR family transcriptional regulator
MSPTTLDPTTLALQEQMIALIRAFGLHRPDHTPCGAPVSVAEAHALMELARDTPLSQNDLVARLQLVKSTVSRCVGLLEARGWVERRRDPHDGRAVALWLTAAGRQAAAQLAAARQVKFARILEHIPPEEREHVLLALTTLVEAMRES